MAPGVTLVASASLVAGGWCEAVVGHVHKIHWQSDTARPDTARVCEPTKPRHPLARLAGVMAVVWWAFMPDFCHAVLALLAPLWTPFSLRRQTSGVGVPLCE